ncbi:MAG TPA: glycosyltransferase [Longilinea sp.]|nr:glycosyltransferase [Longilinea sp.]
MRIACMATSQVPSTTANSIQVMKACHALRQLDHEVCLWVPGDSAVSWEAVAGLYGLTQPFELQWLPSQHWMKRYDLALSTVARAKAWKADLFYTWLPQAALMALWEDMPVVLELHDRLMGSVGPSITKTLLRTPGKKRIAFITKALQTVVEKQLHVTIPDEVAVIAPNAVEMERFHFLPDPPAARARLGLPERLTAVYTGHFYAGRGIDLLVGLAKSFSNIQFLWVGGRAEDVDAWHLKLVELGIHNVIITGFVDNRKLPMYQAAGDILLMPYETKISGSSGGNTAEICSPMKMFEYLASGRAILTSDLPVLHEVLNDENAVFCPPDDLTAWTEIFGALLMNGPKRERLGEQALVDSRQYTWTERAKKIMDF